ncbi:MAG: hypothetical protein HQL99_02870 [Magnetococcales bacterium]|nr:hypothetical protein [Magnetococcales bacterium]
MTPAAKILIMVSPARRVLDSSFEWRIHERKSIEAMKNQYIPDSSTHPGEVIAEYLESRGMSRVELAERSGVDLAEIDGILTGQVPVDSLKALRFEPILGRSARFWCNLQLHHDEALKRRNRAGIGEQGQNIPVADAIVA